MALTVYTSKDNQWREYVNPLRGVTLERIVQLIEQGERGAFADLQWFYQAMERSDAIIATVLMRRRAALLSCQWDVKPEENPKDVVLASEQAAFLRERYDRVKNLREAVVFLSSSDHADRERQRHAARQRASRGVQSGGEGRRGDGV